EALTTASDVYSLGVLLYLLVTGERPYDFDRARPSEIERVICEVEPKRPSARVWMRATASDEDAAALPTRRSLGWPRRAAGDDLDTIVREALRKEPELRYGSVARLSSDLDAYLNELPISARPDTFSYLAGKFVRRHRVPVLGALLLLAVLVGGVVTTSWQAQIAREAQERAELQRAEAASQRDRAELERRRAEETTAFLTDLFDVSDPFRDEGEKQQTTARELLDLGAQRIASEFDDDPLLRASLMTTIGRVYRNLALLDDGDALLSEALELRRKALADDSAGPVLESLSDVADLRLDQERYREAGEILEGLVSERRRRGDPQALALALEDLSLAKRGLDLPQEAEALLAEAFDLHAAAGDDLAVAHNRSLLGQLRLRLGDYPGAEKLQREVLEVRSRELSPDHPRITLSLNDLALTLQAAGQLEPAEALFREVLERQQRAFGDRSHHVALATHNLATVLTYDRQTDKALELYAANAERIAEIYGPDHPAAARNAKAKGMAYQVAGQPAEAIIWVRRSRDIYRYHYGPTHGLTLRDANSLVSLMAKTGDPGAEAAYLELIETLRQNLDPKDWRLSYPLLDLGLLRIKNGEARRAEAVMREALALRRAALPESHWEIALAEGHLGFCLLRLGRLDDAAPLLESSEKGLLQLGEDHAKVETARRRLDELEKARAAS
ncbi:MAG: tetratricopeptide repeat protein, partial [Acidobacteriota bacterium]